MLSGPPLGDLGVHLVVVGAAAHAAAAAAREKGQEKRVRRSSDARVKPHHRALHLPARNITAAFKCA